MITAWIAITLVIALMVGWLFAAIGDDGVFDFAIGFIITLQMSFGIAVVFIAAHFIGKVW